MCLRFSESSSNPFMYLESFIFNDVKAKRFGEAVYAQVF